jgi:hypothetical protein
VLKIEEPTMERKDSEVMLNKKEIKDALKKDFKILVDTFKKENVRRVLSNRMVLHMENCI